MALSYLLFPLLIPVGWYFLYSAYCLAINYRAAESTGLPTVIIPVSPENPVWMLVGNAIASAIERVFSESHFTRFSIRAWIWYDKYWAHLELGDFMVIVTPDKNWLYICNAEALTEVLQRRNDFPRPLEILAMLNIFGPNLSTVEGVDWQRQRKITSAPFNEQNSNLVWTECIRQSQEVLRYWKTQRIPIRTTAKDVRTLSLHVLSNAGFGKQYSFQKSAEPPKPGHMYNYRDSLAVVLDHILLIMILGPDLLTRRFLPKSWSRIGQATIDFKAHMQNMYNEGKHLIANGKPGAVNIINSLIRAVEEVTDNVSASRDQEVQFRKGYQKGLSKSELYGNTFVYNFAGHDTTAITLSYTIYLLAAHPEVQNWIAEEIIEFLKDDDSTNWEYNQVFPKLKRCFAVLLEVIRLYNPLTGIIKSTGHSPCTINLAGKEVTLPANMRVCLNTDAIHTHPRYWGSDSLEWRPQRWVLSSAGEGSTFEREILLTPPQGAYAPWSGGPRVCLGKKFGQVEFVAVVVTLFRKHRIEPVPEKDEDMKEARARTMLAVEDSGMVLLLQMLRPEKAGLRWVEQ